RIPAPPARAPQDFFGRAHPPRPFTHGFRAGELLAGRAPGSSARADVALDREQEGAVSLRRDLRPGPVAGPTRDVPSRARLTLGAIERSQSGGGRVRVVGPPAGIHCIDSGPFDMLTQAGAKRFAPLLRRFLTAQAVGGG